MVIFRIKELQLILLKFRKANRVQAKKWGKEAKVAKRKINGMKVTSNASIPTTWMVMMNVSLIDLYQFQILYTKEVMNKGFSSQQKHQGMKATMVILMMIRAQFNLTMIHDLIWQEAIWMLRVEAILIVHLSRPVGLDS